MTVSLLIRKTKGSICFIAHSLMFVFVSLRSCLLEEDRVKLVSKYSKLLLNDLGIKVTSINEPKKYCGGKLLVANHISTIDILAIASILPSVFITSEDVKTTPLLGWLCSKGAALFVDRRNRSGLKSSISTISKKLQNGTSVVLFPEATSSNGNTVLPFKRALISSAINTTTTIQPICINYTKLEKVSYYGKMTFISHLFRLLFNDLGEIRLTWMDEIQPTNIDSTFLTTSLEKSIRMQYQKYSTAT